MKLGLGTVQFGLPYGISNQQGQTPLREVKIILEIASQKGIEVLDTATLYGNSEEVLGKCLDTEHGFKIVTKTPMFGGKLITAEDVLLLEKTFAQSLKKLKQNSLYGLLIHHSQDLLAADGDLLMESMINLRQKGLVKKIGVSVYTGRQIDDLLDRYNSIDIIQLPINVFDQRLLHGGHLARLKKRGIEIHARSIFLQGLLLMSPADLPDYFVSIKDHVQHYHNVLQSQGITTLQGALGFVLALSEVDVVLCGLNNLQQLQGICTAATQYAKNNFSEFALSDEKILNPSLWQVNAN